MHELTKLEWRCLIALECQLKIPMKFVPHIVAYPITQGFISTRIREKRPVFLKIQWPYVQPKPILPIENHCATNSADSQLCGS